MNNQIIDNNTLPAFVTHPGEILKDELEARNMSQVDLADILGRPLKVIKAIIKGKQSITPKIAMKLAIVFEGISAEFWLGLQKRYDFFVLRKEEENGKLGLFEDFNQGQLCPSY